VPLTPQLIAAYETALYAIADGPVLRIGERNAALDGLLAQRAVASAAFITACLAVCRQTARRVEIEKTEKLPVCRDPDDQKFLELAAAAKADCLVTRDRDLLRLTRRCAPWFRIVPPEAFAPPPA
jgi:predicted nucleic acid-binding protein